MPRKPRAEELSRRERQVMDVLHRRGHGSVTDIMRDLPDEPTYSAVRSVLRILGEKGLVEHSADGAKYVYRPATPTEEAREDVLARVIDTYFAGSTEQAVTALLRMSDADLSDPELARLQEKVREARSKGR
ncbi:MAG: BlaI/MecI/CopY family transcriptional regulator [Gemmatimonadales bacterium]